MTFSWLQNSNVYDFVTIRGELKIVKCTDFFYSLKQENLLQNRIWEYRCNDCVILTNYGEKVKTSVRITLWR